MTQLEKLLLEELDDTEGTISDMATNMLPFGFDALERGGYQDKLNSNVLSNKGRTRN